jgi:CRISPR-associated protein (TIGR02584 family)
MPELEYYNMIATLGVAPAVVTEVVWKYATDPARPRRPASVAVVTTGQGYVAWMTRMAQSGVWARFCQEVLDGEEVKVSLFVPTGRDGGPLEDVVDAVDDTAMAGRCYDLVYRLTRPGTLPLVGSLAGGRKTMSAHLMAAFTVFGRRNDELVHMLVPRELEQDPDFYYPPAGTESPGLVCVRIPFPILQPVLERGLFQALPGQGRDLQAIVDALRRYDHDNAHYVDLILGQEKRLVSLIEVRDREGRVLDTGQLTLQNLATLLTVAQQLTEGGGLASNEELIADLARRRYNAVAGLYGKANAYALWEDAQDISAGVHRLNQQLRQTPAAESHLALRGQRKPESTLYQWQGRPLPIVLHGTAEVLDRAEKGQWGALFPAFPIEPMP